MENQFELPVLYNGNELSFPARIIYSGFAPRFVVVVDEVEVIFERDDSGDFRAILPNAAAFNGKPPERDLLEAIHSSIIFIANNQ